MIREQRAADRLAMRDKTNDTGHLAVLLLFRHGFRAVELFSRLFFQN